MTAYSLNQNQPLGTYAWTDPSLWAQGSVPDTRAAQVTLGYVGGAGDTIAVGQGQSISIGSLGVDFDRLTISGTLSSAGLVTVDGAIRAAGVIDMEGGTLTAQSMNLIVYSDGLSGNGTVTVAGPIYNDSAIWASGGTLDIKAGYFDNRHALYTDKGATLIVETATASGFVNYQPGTLVGGEYIANGTIDLKTPGIVHNLSAYVNIQDSDGMLASYDPSSGKYVSFHDSLTLITASGTLELDSGTFAAANSLTIAGHVVLVAGGDFSAANTLYVTSSGSIDLTEAPSPENYLGLPPERVKAHLLLDDGTVAIDGAGGGIARIDAAVQGTGTIVLGPASDSFIEVPGSVRTTAKVELTQSVTGVGIAFSDDTGTLIVDAPSQFHGRIENFRAGDAIDLTGIDFSHVTGFSFSGNTLSIHENGTVLQLSFTGDHTIADFSLQAGSGGTVIVGVAPASA